MSLARAKYPTDAELDAEVAEFQANPSMDVRMARWLDENDPTWRTRSPSQLRAMHKNWKTR
jgi:hypothetical protein